MPLNSGGWSWDFRCLRRAAEPGMSVAATSVFEGERVGKGGWAFEQNVMQ